MASLFAALAAVHVDGSPVRSYVTPVSPVQGKSVTTIDKVSSPLAAALQDTWVKHDVVQCGYCQSGQIMSTISLLERNPNPSDSDIDQAFQGNLCRCHTYVRIRQAVHTAASSLASQGGAA